MDNENKDNSLADSIVSGATGTPTVSDSRARTQGLMAQSGERGEAVLQSAEDDMQAYMNQMVDTIREERSAATVEADTAVTYDSDDPSIRTSGSLSSFVKQFEGFHDTAYWDNKQWSIGYGTKASGKGATITASEAEKELSKNLNKARSAVLKYKKDYNYDWSPNQIDALTSFAYNLGTGKLATLTDGGSRGDQEISEMMLEYNKAGGKKLPGLVKRRQAEAKLFTQGYDE